MALLPQLVEQLLFRDDAMAMLDEVRQDAEDLRLGVDLPPVAAEPVAV